MTRLNDAHADAFDTDVTLSIGMKSRTSDGLPDFDQVAAAVDLACMPARPPAAGPGTPLQSSGGAAQTMRITSLSMARR